MRMRLRLCLNRRSGCPTSSGLEGSRNLQPQRTPRCTEESQARKRPSPVGSGQASALLARDDPELKLKVLPGVSHP